MRAVKIPGEMNKKKNCFQIITNSNYLKFLAKQKLAICVHMKCAVKITVLHSRSLIDVNGAIHMLHLHNKRGVAVVAANGINR